MTQVTSVLEQIQAGQLHARLEAQEMERNRIGRELHDSIGALLTTTRLYFQGLRGHELEQRDPLFNKIDALLYETIESVRRIASDLRPVVLENLGLAEAIAELARSVKEAGSIEVDCKITYDRTFDQKDELNIYRIVQELFTNGLRHSGASRIGLELVSDVDHFRLTYRDNGKGFRPNQKNRNGLGIKNIENRVNALKGKLTFIDPQEGGVLINIEIENYENNKSCPV